MAAPRQPQRLRAWQARRPAARVHIVAGGVLSAALLAGCSSGANGETAASKSAAPLPSTTAPNAPADSRLQILSQYRAFWAHVTPASRAPASQRRRLLAPFAAEPELSSLLRGMARQDRKGQVIYGRNITHPKIASLSSAKGVAVIADCQDSAHSGVERLSDHKKLTVGVRRNPVSATLHRSATGEWKVAFVAYPNSSC